MTNRPEVRYWRMNAELVIGLWLAMSLCVL